MTAPTSQMARGAVGFHSWHQPRWHKKMVAGSNGAGCKKFDQVNRGQVNNPLLTADVLTKKFRTSIFSIYLRKLEEDRAGWGVMEWSTSGVRPNVGNCLPTSGPGGFRFLIFTAHPWQSLFPIHR